MKPVGYKVPDEECDLDYVTGQGQEMEIEYCPFQFLWALADITPAC